MRHIASAAVALATVSALTTTTLTGLTGLTGTVSASAESAPERAGMAGSSDIALKAYGYGTRLSGGQVPANSDMTAFTAIGCAVKAGLDRDNHVAEVNLPGLGTVSGVTTRLWTRKANGAMHSYSRNSTASVVLAESPLGKLRVRAVTSLSHAWHDARGFHAETRSSIGKLEFVPPEGDPQVLDLPTPGQPVTVPGLATISLGGSAKTVTDDHAIARASALRIHLIPSDTEVFVARTTAQALSGVKHGRFGGYSAGTEIDALDGTITSGRNPLSLMPCQGTDGKVEGKDDVNLDLGGQLIVDAVSSRQWGQRFATRSKAWSRGSVAGVNLGDGALVIDAVVGKATATRKENGKLVRSTAGTTIGSITADGEPQSFPDTGVLEIPGVAKLEPKVVTRVPGGLEVVGLRITLLDGTGAVIDLGVAKTTIRRN